MLLRDVEMFLRQNKMPYSAFGRLAVKDPRFVRDLRNGRTPSPKTERRVRDWMGEYQADRAKPKGE